MTDERIGVDSEEEMTGGWYVQMSGGNGVYTRLRHVGFVGIEVSLGDTDGMTSDILLARM